MFDELERLREDGVVRYLGFTTEDVSPAAHGLVCDGLFDTVQVNYNLLFQHAYNPITDAGLLVEATELGLGTITMRTTTSGIFQEWMETVHPQSSQNYARDLITFVLSNAYVDVALVGMRDPAIVAENADLAATTGDRIDIDQLFRRYRR